MPSILAAESAAPLPVRLLVAGLRPPSAPRVRTALVALGAAAYAAAPEVWASELALNSVHLGLHVADHCQPHGHVSLDPVRLLDYLLSLLPDPDTPEPPDPIISGVWVWGFDVLLAKLSEAERSAFWHRLHGTASYRPPLVLALPAALLGRFGPTDPANTWGAQRFLLLP
ncbi:hypothetical protein [Hymenobacter profundi]|uniref:Uncharacterized protein n=1 Tax=Hymenobacter profundi TaxID=1982110 RepID=A0ABS6WUQ3_9BACT|nr:hypothetical protein [Hymenobacter profundi]MBW3127297.1 hypothetical protein [Hymenobacter profundi]